MAEKKNQTQRTASGSRDGGATKGKRYKYEQTQIEEKKSWIRQIPARVISSVLFAIAFVLLFITWIEPDGVFIRLVYDLFRGLFGQVTFYVAIPGFLYLFIIHAFSGKRPIVMRSICTGVFLLCIGCIGHWFLVYGAAGRPELGSSFQWVKNIYLGGINGTTGGLICGGLAELLIWIFNKILTLVILVFAALLTLLASIKITIPSIVRAIQNRPRANWEDEDDMREPASVVVDHIANKRIEHMENKRKRKQAQELMEQEAERIPPIQQTMTPRRTKSINRAEEIMADIDEDDLPAPAPRKRPIEQIDDSIFTAPSAAPKKKTIADHLPPEMPALDMDDIPSDQPQPTVAPVAEAKPKVTAKDAAESAAQVAAEIARNEAIEKPAYSFPPIELLKDASGAAVDSTAEMRENSRRLNETLASFRIEAHIINVTRGPSVTRYEVELDKGVRLNKLTTIADDIALSLGASGVRIAAVPGRISVVGIEVPNRAVTTVSLREVIDSDAFRNAKSKTSFSVGKDIGGNCIVGNIAKLPHMLIAGTTGSGKSVCMNSIIISLLYKASPEEVKLIMVDPKMVELGIYNSIPHLLIPVVTDPKKAAGSLQWAVTEMMRRYKAMSDAGVRDLESYNAIMESEEGTKLPQVVVIIDELADLMLVAAKEVEESICRIAQMGRASGIHLIIATQRPSADVITGLMKANIPSRIAFAVASAMESRIILDTQGAEKLVGKGDMLFAPIGSGKPLRVQGCFVSDTEVEAVTSYVKEHFNADYDNDILKDIEKRAMQAGGSASKGAAAAATVEPNDAETDGDEMLPAAVDVILETGQASVSMLQRRLKLGYARAARIVDEMEEKGIVGAFQGSKPRDILITKEQWAAMRGGEAEQPAFDDADEPPFDEDAEDFE